jgi:hypothetical protein
MSTDKSERQSSQALATIEEKPLVLWTSDEATQLLATYPTEVWVELPDGAPSKGEPRP